MDRLQHAHDLQGRSVRIYLSRRQTIQDVAPEVVWQAGDGAERKC